MACSSNNQNKTSTYVDVFHFSDDNKVKVVSLERKGIELSNGITFVIPGVKFEKEQFVLFQTSPTDKRNKLAEKIARRFTDGSPQLSGEYCLGLKGTEPQLSRDVSRKMWNFIQKVSHIPKGENMSFPDVLDFLSLTKAIGLGNTETLAGKMGSNTLLLRFARMLTNVETHPIDFVARFKIFVEKATVESIGNTIEAIGGGQRAINFLSGNSGTSFSDILHLISHLGKNEVGQLVETLGSPSTLLEFMTNLDIIGSLDGECVHTFVKFVDRSGGVDRTCAALSNNPIAMSEEFGHLLIHICKETFFRYLLIFDGPTKLLAFVEAVGCVHKFCDFIKKYGPLEVMVLIATFGSVEMMTSLFRAFPGIIDDVLTVPN